MFGAAIDCWTAGRQNEARQTPRLLEITILR